jgi:hypothetical protein
MRSTAPRARSWSGPARRPPRARACPRAGGAAPEHVKDESDAHTERNLDKGLEETFPASDPVSISPGAD